MAVVLRLARHGQHNRPLYRIVAAQKAARRDGRFIEILGSLNNLKNPPVAVMKEDRVKHWIANGATVSGHVADLIKKQIPGLLEERLEHARSKIRAARTKRKTRAKSKSKKK